MCSGSGEKGDLEKLNQWVEDWLSARAEAESTRKNYLRHIKIFSDFCQTRGKDFYGIVEEYRAARRSGYEAELDFTESWQDLIRAYYTCIKRGGYAPLTQKNYLSTPKSFFSFYKIPVDIALPKRACVKYHNRDLTRENIRKILSKASQRDRTIWLLMAESGLRAGTAIHLKYWHIKEDFEKGIVPMRIITPAESLKDHVGDRWSFIGEDGVKALREYLQPRMPLKDQDFVFGSKKPGIMRGEQFTTASLSTLFRRIVRALKLENSIQYGKPSHFRMHGLRKYFRNSMRVDPSFREFWMGHSLGVDAHYVSRDPEFHRKEYKKGYESLRILEPATPAQLTEIVDQLKHKDTEIQELRTQNERLSARMDKLAEPLEMFKEMDIAELSKDEERTPLGILIQYLKLQAAKELKDEIQKLKKPDNENAKEE